MSGAGISASIHSGMAMRIAVLVEVFPSVSETFILNQLTGLIDQGHEVHIFANQAGRTDTVHADVVKYDLMSRLHHASDLPANPLLRRVYGVRVILSSFMRRPVEALRVLWTLAGAGPSAIFRAFEDARLFRNERSFDVFLCHFGPNGLRAIRLRDAKIVEGRIVTFFHGNDMSSYLERTGPRAYDPLFDRGELCLPISNLWRDRLLALGCPPNKVVVHRMGIDCSKFAFAPRIKRADDPLRLVSVARLVEKKGIGYAIRAVAELAQSGVVVRYTILGDGPLRGQLEKEVRELGVDESVELRGFVEHGEVVAALRDAHVMLAPSVTAEDGDMEGIPVAIMEAMATGLPVLSTTHSAIPEIICHRRTGFLVPERDSRGIASELGHIAEDPGILQRIGAAARKYVESHYDIGVLNRVLEQRLTQLVNGDQRRST